MGDWTEVIIEVAVRQGALAGEIAHMVTPYGIYVEDYSDLEQGAREIAHIDLIDEALLACDRETAKVHLYLSPQDHPLETVAWLRERFTAAGVVHKLSTRACRNEDWENNWKAYFHPLPVGKRLLIQPVWEAPADPQGRAVLLLEPGLAFGSGSHATTRLCMEALERYVTPGSAVLDIGCGSGILSAAALLLGAGSALGVDIDAMAVQNARENAARNHLEERAQFAQGNLTEHITGVYDIVVSNIVADAIIALASQVRGFLKPGGVWLSAGIIDTRGPETLQAIEGAGFAVTHTWAQEGWLCIAAR